ncbi:hypothetical protein ENHAE0001_0787 [Enhydrobacter aerosaccus SK60]|nr:hypothetical protein ENHAE0001_0787 [Enhydrobacter aerosaccus SK60]
MQLILAFLVSKFGNQNNGSIKILLIHNNPLRINLLNNLPTHQFI